MEWIDYRARITEDGKVQSLGSFSTGLPRGTHYRKSSGNAVLELLSNEGKVLVNEAVAIAAPPHCHAFEPDYRIAAGRVPLIKGAVALRLVEGKTVLHEQKIGTAPRINLNWPHTSVDRSKPVSFEPTLSDAGEDAFLLIGLEWQRGRMTGLGVQRPATAIKIDFGALPGGPECRLHVVYTNGLRSSRATTAPFALAPPNVNGKILRPRPGTKFVNDEVIVLEADVTPGNRVANDDLEWHMGGRLVAVGRHAVLNGVVTGAHEIKLVLRDTQLDTIAVTVGAN